MNSGLDIPSTLSVVPLVSNVGIAILPAILASLASAVSLLFKPRELIRTFRRRPMIPMILVLIGVGGYFLVSWMLAAPSKAKADPWVQAAIEYIQEKQQGTANLSDGTTRPVKTTTAPTLNLADSVVFRYGFSRCGHDGGPSPLALKPCWSYTDLDAMFLSSPAVVGKRVYAASTTLDPIANEKFGTVVCLDAATKQADLEGRGAWRGEVQAILQLSGDQRGWQESGDWPGAA